MSKHTPAPWVVRDPEEAGNKMLGIMSVGVHPHQGLAYTVGLHKEIDIANAKLIAAAPELLEACKEVSKFLNDGDSALEHLRLHQYRAWKKLEQAIKKAECEDE